MKSSKRFRIQFSLRTFLVVVLVSGTAMGIWVGMIQPINNQWAAVEPILKLGGRVETSPSKIPSWMKRILPEGKTENIEAVFFNYQPATNEAIEALERLPHLKRLYVEKASLSPKHLETIAKLENLERLSIWGNRNLKNDDIAALADLEKLEVLDLHACPESDWIALVPFVDNQKIRIVHSFYYFNFEVAHTAQPDKLKTIKRFFMPLQDVTLMAVQSSDLKTLLEHFPTVSSVWLSYEGELDSTYFTDLLEIRRDKPLKITLYAARAKNLPPVSSRTQVSRTIRLAWEKLGPHCDSLGIETASRHPGNTNQLTFGWTKDQAPIKVSVFIDSDLEIPENFFKQLPALPDVQTFSLNSYGDDLIPGMEHVLKKFSGVTEVNSYQAGKWQTKFWDWLAKLDKVEKLSITNSSTALQGVPEDLPEKFLLRKTLTELEIQLYCYDSEVAGRFLKACPQLKSFKFNYREVKRDGKGGVIAR